MIDYTELEKLLAKKQAERDTYRALLQESENITSKLITDIEVMQKVIVVFQKASALARQQMKTVIEDLTTNALQVVFGNDIKFVVELGTRAGAPVAEFYVEEDGKQYSPLDARGGGLVDVISAAIRLAIIELYDPIIEGPIMLDEPGRMVSAEYIENFVYFLKEYAHKVKRQFIVITHQQALSAAGDKTFTVTQKNNNSEVRG